MTARQNQQVKKSRIKSVVRRGYDIQAVLLYQDANLEPYCPYCGKPIQILPAGEHHCPHCTKIFSVVVLPTVTVLCKNAQGDVDCPYCKQEKLGTATRANFCLKCKKVFIAEPYSPQQQAVQA